MKYPPKMVDSPRLSLILLSLCVVTNYVNSLPVPVKLYEDPYGSSQDLAQKLEELQRQKLRLETIIGLSGPSVHRTFLEQELNSVNAWIQYIEANSAVTYKDYLKMIEGERKQLERERALQKEQLERERTIQREQLEREKAILKEQFAKMTDRQKELFAGDVESHWKQREKKVAKIDEQLEKETAKLKEKYGKEKAQRRDQFEKEKAKRKEEFEKEKAKRKEQFEEEKNKRKEEYDKEVAKQRENFEKEKNKKREMFDKEKAKKREKYDKKMKKVREKFEEEEAKQKEQFDTEKVKRKELFRKTGKGEQLKNEEAKQKEQFDKEKKKRREEYEKTKAKLKEKFEKKKAKKQDLFNKEKERQRVQNENEKIKRKEEFEKEKTSQKEQFDRKIDGLKEQFEKVGAEQKKQFDKDSSRQNKEFERVRKALKKQFEKEKEILEKMESERINLQGMERLKLENSLEIGTTGDAVHAESHYQRGNNQQSEDRKGLKQKLEQILNSPPVNNYEHVRVPHQEEIDELRRGMSMGEDWMMAQAKLEDLLRKMYEESQLPPEIAYGDFEKRLDEMEKNILSIRDRQFELRTSLAEKMKKKDLDDYDGNEEEIESFRRVDQTVRAANEYLQDIARRKLYLKGISQVVDLLIECSDAVRG